MESEIKEYMKSKFGMERFAKESDVIPVFAQNERKIVTIFVLRETIAPLIDRSDDPESTITFVMRLEDGEEREVVEVPARKFKSKEKLAGLRICRMFNAVDPGYEYNNVKEKSYLANPNSVIFGDSVVVGKDVGQAMLPSRVYYSSSYSIRSKSQITRQLVHNSLSEAGTMWDRDSGKNRTSLFNTEYIEPGTLLPSFISMRNPTPESLIHLILCLNETKYGAQTAITGPNVKNNIVALYFGEEELPVTSYTISRDLQGKVTDNLNKNDLMKLIMENAYDKMSSRNSGIMISGKELDEFLMKIKNLSYEDLSTVYKTLKKDADDLIEYAKINDSGKKSKKNKGNPISQGSDEVEKEQDV